MAGFQPPGDNKFIQTRDPQTCDLSINYSGKAGSKTAGNWGGGSSCSLDWSIVNATTGEWEVDGGGSGSLGCWMFNPYTSPITYHDGVDSTNTVTQTPTTYESTWTGSTNYPEYAYEFTETETSTLSKVFTDRMLHDKLVGHLPAYPDESVDDNWKDGGDCAKYWLADDHASCAGSKMKYRFFLCDTTTSQKGQSFKLTWTESIIYPDNTTNNTEKFLIYTADGNPNGTYVGKTEVPVPETRCTITESSAIITPIGTPPNPPNPPPHPPRGPTPGSGGR